MASASFRELGATAPIVFGCRAKVDRKCQASPANEGRPLLARGSKPAALVRVSVREYDLLAAIGVPV
jgi:hypothetical protein